MTQSLTIQTAHGLSRNVSIRHVAFGRLCWGVFMFTLGVYLMTASGHLQGQDQEYYYRMAQALIQDGSFAIEPMTQDATTGARGVDGRFYTQYAPGLPIALAPLVAAGRGVAGPIASLRSEDHQTEEDAADSSARFIVSYFNVPITAASAALLAYFLLKLRHPPAAAVFTALAFALATLAWGNSRIIFPEPLQGVLLLLSFLLLWQATRLSALFGGAFLGLAILVKLTSLLAIPGFFLLRDADGRPIWRGAAASTVLGSILVALALHGLYNHMRFGNPLVTAYTSAGGAPLQLGNPLVALYGLLLSPGRGIFGYAPPLLVAIWASGRFHRRHPDWGLSVSVVAALWLSGHSLYSDWDGGWGWGPRYLLPILPLALAPLALCWLDNRARLAAQGLTLLGVLAQIPGATVNFMDAGRQLMTEYAQRCIRCDAFSFRDWYYFTPANSDIRVQAELLLAGRLDIAWLSFHGTWLVPVTVGLSLLLAIPGLVLMCSALSGQTQSHEPTPESHQAAV
jgi:hypothetical protein